MEYMMGSKLNHISVDMNIVKKLCKINEYKGEQIIYKKQTKNIVMEMTDNAIFKFVYDTYSNNFTGGKEYLIKLIHNEVAPQSREDIGVVEFRDVIKTVNSAYEDIQICSQGILELHGYLHRYSLVSGGRYRNESARLLNLDFGKYEEFSRNLDIEAEIEKELNTCVKNMMIF